MNKAEIDGLRGFATPGSSRVVEMTRDTLARLLAHVDELEMGNRNYAKTMQVIATLPAPTISQDVPAPAADCEYCDGTGDVHRADGEWLGACPEGHGPPNATAPAAVTAEMVREARSAWMGAQVLPDKCDAAIAAHLNAALSAATPLQSDLAAENARLREAASFLLWQYERKGPVLDCTEAWEQLRAALQGADNHE